MALRQTGTRVRAGSLSATYLDDGGHRATRVGYAITKRVGGAVVRNRLRRRLRALCAELARSRPDLVPRGALVIAAGPDAIHRTPDELRNDVLRLLADLRNRRGPVAR